MKHFHYVATLLCFSAISAVAQISQIDRSKIPQDPDVQHVYTDLLPIDQFARTYEATWHFPIPKAEVTSRFKSGLRTLEKAQKETPANTELQLFTGLVAHLAYNLDIEEAYPPAIKLLTTRANDDYRATWFLGMHQCQSNDTAGGMRRLLLVEDSASHIPGIFWQDYANCASVANMPVHAIRAYDNARKDTDNPSIDLQLEKVARNRIKPSSITTKYPAKQAWDAVEAANHVRFTSSLCGESFTTKSTNHIDVADVENGSCTVIIKTDQYPNRHGSSSASLLILTQTATPGESLEAFSQRLLKDSRYAGRTPMTGLPCPISICLSFEINTDKLYSGEGGAHLLAIFFQSEQPAYPGLRFETPQALPKSAPDKSGKPIFYRPEESLQRFNGTIYTFLALDANQDIYPKARVDFEGLLQSLIVDSK